jgi:hypothetical protein
MPKPSLTQSLVRILIDDQDFRQTVGAGFLVSARHIITCAHVIAEALNIPQDTPDKPTERIYLEFPLIADHTLVEATVLVWHPVQDTVAMGNIEDIAVLELSTPLPTQAQPIELAKLEYDAFFNRAVRLCGFPSGMEEGDWIKAELQGPTRTGYVQLDNEAGQRSVAPGFSGTAVWDELENKVVGMIVSINTRESATSAYMIPIATLHSAWSELHQYAYLHDRQERDVTISSPYFYVYWSPVTPPLFAGRDRELQQLDKALTEGRSISLIGDLQMGKTSLLRTWQQQLRQRGQIIALVNGEDSSAQSLPTFIQAITGFKQIPDDPDEAADALLRWAEQQDTLPLVIVDRVEACLNQFPPRFFIRLRGMLDKIIFAFASNQSIDNLYADLGHTSPFGNQFGVIRLNLLTQEAMETITHWQEKVLDREAISTMQTYAGRHPFYLQLLGYHLIEARDMGHTLDDVLDTFYEDASSRLQRWWKTLNTREQQTLRETLQGKKVSRRSSLRTRGFVTEEGEVFGQVLQEWLEQET